MIFMLFFLFVIESLCLYYCDWKITKIHTITPIMVLTIPFIGAFILYFCVANSFNYISIDYRVIIYWMLGTFMFWLGGRFTFLVMIKKINTKINNLTYIYKIMSVICLVSSLLIIIRAIEGIFIDNINVFSKTELPTFLALGVYGYYRILVIATLTCILCRFRNERREIIEYIAIICGSIALILYHIKGIFLPPFIAFVFYRIIFDFDRRIIKNILKLTLIIFIAFFTAYSLPYFINKELSYIFTYQHINELTKKITNYFFAGILGFSGYLQSGIIDDRPWYTLISPIYNVLQKLKFDNSESIKNIVSYMFIRISPDISSNVYSIWGTIWELSGTIGICIMGVVMGFCSYLSLKLAIYRNNRFFKIGYSYLLFYLFMGVFDYFFFQPYILIVITLLYAIAFMSEKRLKFVWKNK